jgi:hypothetical protein
LNKTRGSSCRGCLLRCDDGLHKGCGAGYGRGRSCSGNSVFVGEGFKSFADQWAYLASIRRIRPIDAELVAQEATGAEQVIGLRIADTDEEEPAPWARPPSGRVHMTIVAGPLPPEVKAVLAQRLYIERAGLPPDRRWSAQA